MTVLFADLADSTALISRTDPEAAREILARFFRAMREEIQKFAGSIEKFIGDAVMAVFGLPASHEDDPVRAIEAALAMRARLDSLNHELQPEFGVTVQMRIGIDTGEVMAAAGPAEGRDFLVTGDAVNVAARLETHAGPRQILVGERTYRFSRDHFLFRPVGPLALKGKDAPVAAWEVVGPAPAIRPARTATTLVDRETELQVLRDRYRHTVAARRPHLVVIAGEAGIGKSRLTQEFVQALAGSEPAPVVRFARWFPYGETTAYAPLAEILKVECGILDTDPPSRAREKLTTGLSRIEAGDYADALGYSIGLEFPDSAIARLEPQRVGKELARAWAVLFEQQARRRPLVVVLEDLHWAGDPIFDLIEFVLQHTHDAPVLLLGMTRPELFDHAPDWGVGGDARSVIALKPLQMSEGEQLLDSIAQPYQVPDSLRRRILDNAEGNPFFLEEMVRMLLDAGPAAQEQPPALPDTVQGVIAARIDRLPALPRAVLQRASVIGRVFWLGPMRSYVDPEQLEQATEELKRKEFILDRAPSGLEGEREYAFRHVLIQEVAVATLPRTARGQIHQQVAVWLEQLAGPRIGELVEPLAYHYREAARLTSDAGSSAKAGRFLQLAAESAYRRYALREAAAHAHAAMEFADASGRSAIEEFLGDVMFQQGRSADAERHYRAALAGRVSAREQARLYRKIVPTVSIDRAMDELERARALLASDPDPAEEATLLVWLGRIAHHRMEYDRASEYFVQARRILHEMGRSEELARCLHYFGLTLIHRGRSAEAVHVAEELQSIGDELKHPYIAATAHRLLTEAHLHRGAHLAALKTADLILSAGAAVGTEAAASSLRMKGRVLGRMGRLEEAAEVLRRALALAEHLERSEMPVAMIAEPLATVLGDLGEREEARAVLARGHQMARTAGHPEQQIRMTLAELRVATITGQPHPVLELSESLLQKWPNSRALQVQMLAAIGQAWAEVNEGTRAARAAVLCREIATSDGAAHETFEGAKVLGRVAMLAGRWEEAIGHLHEAAEGFLGIASRLEWGRTLALLAEARIGSGHTNQGRALFDQARATLRECRAMVDLANLDASERRLRASRRVGS